MKKLYYTLFILSSLIIGTAAIAVSESVGTVIGEVEEVSDFGWGGTSGVSGVIVWNQDKEEGTVTDWGGEFTYETEMTTLFYETVLLFYKEGYNSFDRPVSINANATLDLGILIITEISE